MEYDYPQPGGEYVTSLSHPPTYLRVRPMGQPGYALPVVASVERDGKYHLTLGDRVAEVPAGEYALTLLYGDLPSSSEN